MFSDWLKAVVSLVFAFAILSGCSDNGTLGPDGGRDGFVIGPDASPVCTGDNNSVITREELPVVLSTPVDYLVNPPGSTVQVAPDGTVGGGGERMWDFTSIDGVVMSVTALPITNAWYGPDFPDATYAAVLNAADSTLGVYRVDDQAVWLLGFVSPEEDRTLAVYDPPVPSLRFPIEEGLNWVSVGEITNAVYDGQPFASTDTYRVSVDQRGTARLPYLDLLNTLRVRVDLTQSLPGGTTLRYIQYLYVHECYGELARIVSQQGELDPHFTEASEFRRLAL